jgi:hypothetical protein
MILPKKFIDSKYPCSKYFPAQSPNCRPVKVAVHRAQTSSIPTGPPLTEPFSVAKVLLILPIPPRGSRFLLDPSPKHRTLIIFQKEAKNKVGEKKGYRDIDCSNSLARAALPI